MRTRHLLLYSPGRTIIITTITLIIITQTIITLTIITQMLITIMLDLVERLPGSTYQPPAHNQAAVLLYQVK